MPSHARIRVEIGGSAAFEGGLLLPAASGITDGTSNTIMFTLGDGSVRAGWAQASPIWSRPQALRSGCGLVLPVTARSSVRTGGVLPALGIHTENIDNKYPDSHVQEGPVEGQGIVLERSPVVSVAFSGGGTTVWLEPQGIIAVLIGL